MGIKDIQRKLSTKEINPEIGCFSIISFGLVFIGAVGLLVPLIRLIFCSILGVRCIDDETGQNIEIPWIAIGLLIGLGLILYYIERIYFRLKNNK